MYSRGHLDRESRYVDDTMQKKGETLVISPLWWEFKSLSARYNKHRTVTASHKTERKQHQDNYD